MNGENRCAKPEEQINESRLQQLCYPAAYDWAYTSFSDVCGSISSGCATANTEAMASSYQTLRDRQVGQYALSRYLAVEG